MTGWTPADFARDAVDQQAEANDAARSEYRQHWLLERPDRELPHPDEYREDY